MIYIYCTRNSDFIPEKNNNPIVFPPVDACWKPELQADCAKTIASWSNTVDVDIHIKTWSSTMINYLGELVEKKMANPNNIKVIAEGHDKESYYNAEGGLVNWPYGWFLISPEYYDHN